MKLATDFRRMAREALSGKWGVAVIAGLIAALLGGIASSNNVEFNIDLSGGSSSIEILGQQIPLTGELWGVLAGAAAFLFIAALVTMVVYMVLGSVIELGYMRFNLDLVDRQKQPELNSLFGYFQAWRTAFCARFLRGLYIFLWSLLFVIPGIVAEYSYAMTGFILAENPEMTASEAIEKSKEIMYGNRWRLFCLRFSFIGWSFLSALTLGIGNLWLTPYRQAADAAFYREITGTAYIVDAPVTN